MLLVGINRVTIIFGSFTPAKTSPTKLYSPVGREEISTRNLIEMSLNHFSHKHPLELSEKKRNDRVKCKACDKYCDGPTYSCKLCKFNLEKSCAELEMPRKLLIPIFHPHLLTLAVEPNLAESYIDAYPGHFHCDACLQNHGGFSYWCEMCYVYIDVKCALQIYLHQNPSRIVQMHGEDDNKSHKSAADQLQLPREYQHFNHPCVLIRRLKTEEYDEYECGACGTYCQGPYYHCKRHDFKIGINCILQPATVQSQGEPMFYHFSHGHPFILKEISQDDEIHCAACLKCCSGQTYICCSSKCKFSLHHSCFDLPQEIHHPFHPSHTLTLTRPEEFTTCNACFSCCHGFTYSCSACKFNLDVECPVISSTIEYQGHHHNLLFIQNVGHFIIRQDILRSSKNDGFPSKIKALVEHQCNRCLACGAICKPSSSIFRCVECNINLHLECGPLPHSIQHENYSLSIADSPLVDVEGGDKLDSHLFYCDSCEKERDPRLPVYYFFDGCAYIAEIKCVMSEIMLSLTGEYGEVELMSPIRHIAGKVISKGMVKGIELEEAGRAEKNSNIKAGKAKVKTHNRTRKTKVKPSTKLFQIVGSLTEEERKEYRSLYDAAQNDWPWKNNGSTENSCLLSEDDYPHFMKLLDDGESITAKLVGTDEKMVNVGEHSVTEYLAPILKDLLAKYGDITAESTLKSSKLKTYFTVRLCETVQGMCAKRVADISKYDLFNWFINLKLLQAGGFKVEFTFDRFKRVYHAYHGIQLRQSVDKELEEIDREIANLSRDVEKLKAKLVAKPKKLESLMEKRKDMESLKPESSSKVDNQCLKEASVLKWMTAGYGLL